MVASNLELWVLEDDKWSPGGENVGPGTVECIAKSRLAETTAQKHARRAFGLSIAEVIVEFPLVPGPNPPDKKGNCTEQ